MVSVYFHKVIFKTLIASYKKTARATTGFVDIFRLKS